MELFWQVEPVENPSSTGYAMKRVWVFDWQFACLVVRRFPVVQTEKCFNFCSFSRWRVRVRIKCMSTGLMCMCKVHFRISTGGFLVYVRHGPSKIWCWRRCCLNEAIDFSHAGKRLRSCGRDGRDEKQRISTKCKGVWIDSAGDWSGSYFLLESLGHCTPIYFLSFIRSITFPILSHAHNRILKNIRTSSLLVMYKSKRNSYWC